MLPNALPTNAVARGSLLENIRGISSHANRMRESVPQIAQATLDGVSAWAHKAAGQMTPDEAWRILAAMGAPAITQALAPTPSGERKLLERAKQGFERIKDVSKSVIDLDVHALDALRAIGFPYDAKLESDTAACLWMTKGAAFGEKAWRARNARRHPVVGWWASHGFNIPSQGLCADGVALMEEAVRKLAGPGKMTLELSNALHKCGRDLRVALAFATLGDPIGVAHARAIPDAWKGFIRQALSKDASAHAQLKAAKFRESMPAIEAILALREVPATPEAFMTACGTPEQIAAFAVWSDVFLDPTKVDAHA